MKLLYPLDMAIKKEAAKGLRIVASNYGLLSQPYLVKIPTGY